MKINEINSFKISNSANVRSFKNCKICEQPIPEQKENVNFKGKGFAFLGGLLGSVVGVIAAGILGTFICTLVGAGIGSQMKDNKDND